MNRFHILVVEWIFSFQEAEILNCLFVEMAICVDYERSSATVTQGCLLWEHSSALHYIEYT